MNERGRNFLVGVCAAGALASAAVLLFLFGEIEPLFRSRWPLEVALNEAGGLRRGSLVTMNGVPVGAIQEIEFNASDRNLPVLVTALIDNSILIPDPSTPTVRASLLGSGARLELTVTLPLSTPTRNYERDKSVRLRGRVVALETRMLEELAPQLEPIIASFREMEKLSRNLNEFVRAPAQGEAPQAESLRGVVARFNSTLDRANTALDGATSWLNDEQLRTDVRDTANGASELMRDAAIAANRIATAADALGNAAESVKSEAASVRNQLVPVLDSLGASFDEVNRLLGAARTGEGTVGRLMKDPALYQSLSDAAQRLEGVLAKMELLLDKVRAEGLNVDLLGK